MSNVLETGEWDEHLARDTVRAIVGDARAHRSSAGLWPLHASDRESNDDPDAFTGLYMGAAGMEWASA